MKNRRKNRDQAKSRRAKMDGTRSVISSLVTRLARAVEFRAWLR